MLTPEKIDYGNLIDRLIQEFKPVKRIWPVSVRLSLWILLEAAILVLAAIVGGTLPPDSIAMADFRVYGPGAAGFIAVSIAAAWVALKNCIPGRESGIAEMTVIALGTVAAAAISLIEPPGQILFSGSDLLPAIARETALGALPWVALVWAARRAMPLRPSLIGGLIGLAASSFSIAVQLLAIQPVAIIPALAAAMIVTAMSALGGEVWLDSRRLWSIHGSNATSRLRQSVWLESRIILPGTAALAGALLLIVLRAGLGLQASVPDFDLAIENYQDALADFRPNVPSGSLDAVLTAYVERGMPAYMWDFGPQGFKLHGGRLDHLADGAPVTFTWFHGKAGGMMCMIRQVSAFVAPPMAHYERHHLLFYRYRGYSVCLINIGGYGNFVSVIVSPISIKPFMHVVLSALS